MKCKNCGYEIEKPNLRKCPCCGKILETEDPVQQQVLDTPSTEGQNNREPLENNAILDELQPYNFCPSCGTKLHGENFCPNCGYNLRNTETPVKEEVVEENPEPEPAQQTHSETMDFFQEESELEGTPEVIEEEPVQERPIRNARADRRRTHEPYTQEYDAHHYDEMDDDDHGYNSAIIEDDGMGPVQQTPSDSSWLIITGVAIGSLLVGGLLFLII